MGLLRRGDKAPRRSHLFEDVWYQPKIAYILMAPALIAFLAINLYPIAFSILVAFTNMSLRNLLTGYHFVGLYNFKRLLGSLDSQFYYVMARTFFWTAVNVSLQVLFGLAFALLYNSKHLIGKGALRSLMIIPWAVPGYIAILIWRGMYNVDFGAINHLLKALGFKPINWLMDVDWAFVAYNITNTWLAYPFMMTVTMGALQSIPPDLYESAMIDGANAWQRFWHITLPLIKRPLAFATILTTNTTFQNFGVPYLLNGGGPARRNEIVMVYGYKEAFVYYNFGYSAAFLDLVLIIVLIIGFIGMKVSKLAEER